MDCLKFSVPIGKKRAFSLGIVIFINKCAFTFEFNHNFSEMEFHIIELQKFRKMSIIEPKKKEFWLWYIDYANREMVEMGAIDYDKIAKARKEFKKIQSNNELMDIIRRQELFEWDQTTSLNNARKEGEAIGEKRGEKRGEKLGEKRSKEEIAKKMKQKGIDIGEISDITGLSLDEIEKI